MDKGMDKNIKTLLDDTKKLIREKRAMYSGPEEMASFIDYLDYCAGRLRGPGKLSTWTQITNLRCDIVEHEKRFVREAGKADPEAGRKLRLMLDEAYQKKWGIRYINSSLPAERLFFIKPGRQHKKYETFRELLEKCSARSLLKYYLALYGETEGAKELADMMTEIVLAMRSIQQVPAGEDYIMLEERENGGNVYDHAYILDHATARRRELSSVYWKEVLGMHIPYDIKDIKDIHMFAAVVLHEMLKDGADFEEMQNAHYREWLQSYGDVC